jgi:diaminopimelate decarboxylase
VGGLPLTRLAERVGQTPFYAYDRALLAARVDAVRTACRWVLACTTP